MELAAWSDAGGKGTPAAAAYQKAFPGLRTFRAFSSSLPASIEHTNAAGMHALGLQLIASCKPPKVPTAAGNATLDKWLQSLAAGDRAANWHEGENDMDGPTYRKVVGNLCDRGAVVNPDLRLGSIAMAFQWIPGKNVQNPDDWYDERLDWLGCDLYFSGWQFPGNTPLAGLSPEKNPGFMRWYKWAANKGKPLLINEFGIHTGIPDDVRAQAYDQAFRWLSDAGFELVSPWNDASDDVFGYWGAHIAHPLTAQVVQAWTAKNLDPPPGPAPAADPVPWAVPITPDPTDRIKALQADLSVAADGELGNTTLSALEAAVAERDVLRARIAAVAAALSGSPA